MMQTAVRGGRRGSRSESSRAVEEREEIKEDERRMLCMEAWSSGHDSQEKAHDLHGPSLLRSWHPFLLSASSRVNINHDMIELKLWHLYMELGNGPEQWLLCCMPQFTVAQFSLSNANDYKNLMLFVIRQTACPWLLPLFWYANWRPSWKNSHYCHVTDLPYVVRNQE